MSKLNTEKRNEISDGTFAFTKQRKEPLEDASHVETQLRASTRCRASPTLNAMRRGIASRRRPKGMASRSRKRAGESSEERSKSNERLLSL